LNLRGADDTALSGNDTLTTEAILSGRDPQPAVVGRVRVDEKEYVLRGGSLMLADEQTRQAD